jgi:hypothetical protein
LCWISVGHSDVGTDFPAKYFGFSCHHSISALYSYCISSAFGAIEIYQLNIS